MVENKGGSSTLIGNPGLAGSVDGCGSSAKFGSIYSITFAGGYLFVIDNEYHNLRKIDPSTGAVIVNRFFVFTDIVCCRVLYFGRWHTWRGIHRWTIDVSQVYVPIRSRR